MKAILSNACMSRPAAILLHIAIADNPRCSLLMDMLKKGKSHPLLLCQQVPIRHLKIYALLMDLQYHLQRADTFFSSCGRLSKHLA